MEIDDSQLIQFLNNPEFRVRSAAIECLSASFCNDAKMLRAIFDAWDEFGAEAAFPEFAILTHLPADAAMADETLLRASAMVRNRKILDPVCRCAGKLIEAYSVALPKTYDDFLPRFEKLRRESKIFFRVDVNAMTRRAEISQQSDEALWQTYSAADSIDATLPSAIEKLRAVLDELNERGLAQPIWTTVLAELAMSRGEFTTVTGLGLEVLSRRSIEGFADQRAALLDAKDPRIADAVAISLARSRDSTVLDAICKQYNSLDLQGRLRAAAILQRLRIPGVASRIRLLRDMPQQESAVIEAMIMAEILQFDFDNIEDWLEALMVIDDSSLRRIQQKLHLAIPLAQSLPLEDQPRFMQLFRSRLASV